MNIFSVEILSLKKNGTGWLWSSTLKGTGFEVLFDSIKLV